MNQIDIKAAKKEIKCRFLEIIFRKKGKLYFQLLRLEECNMIEKPIKKIYGIYCRMTDIFETKIRQFLFSLKHLFQYS